MSNPTRTKLRTPMLGVLAVTLAAVSIALPFALGPRKGGEIDMNINIAAPIIVAALALAALARHERTIWPVIAIVLGVFYVCLHLIAIP